MTFRFSTVTNSFEETQSLGKSMAKFLVKGDVICLYGDLGAGKTVFVQGVCQGLDCEDVVSSPTFTIINEYKAKMPIFHFDFYRLADESEIYGLGYEEYFYDDGICLIEWAERGKNLLPEHRIEINIRASYNLAEQNKRWIEICVPDLAAFKRIREPEKAKIAEEFFGKNLILQ